MTRDNRAEHPLAAYRRRWFKLMENQDRQAQFKVECRTEAKRMAKQYEVAAYSGDIKEAGRIKSNLGRLEITYVGAVNTYHQTTEALERARQWILAFYAKAAEGKESVDWKPVLKPGRIPCKIIKVDGYKFYTDTRLCPPEIEAITLMLPQKPKVRYDRTSEDPYVTGLYHLEIGYADPVSGFVDYRDGRWIASQIDTIFGRKMDAEVREFLGSLTVLREYEGV